MVEARERTGARLTLPVRRWWVVGRTGPRKSCDESPPTVPAARYWAARVRALLAEPQHAAPYFQAALADDTLEQWPFERAQTRWTTATRRRQRRIAEACPPLTAARGPTSSATWWTAPCRAAAPGAEEHEDHGSRFQIRHQ